MTGTVNEGQLVVVDAPDFSGQAGLQGDTLAYFPNKTNATTKAGSRIIVAGVERRAKHVAPSDYVRGMTVVELVPL
jgi:hypothetical protein